MKPCSLSIFIVLVLFVAGCQSTGRGCPPATGTPNYLAASPKSLATATPGPEPLEVQVGRKLIRMDKIVAGPLCNDSWSGNVYVACDVQVYPWQDAPTFLEDCDLNIAPGTVVYVAYHNDTAYYNGCSCHTGEIGEP
jgi:hypothetical protein